MSDNETNQATDKSLEDSILLAHVKQGNKQSFRLLVDRYIDRVWRVAFRVLEDAAEAEDVTQEVFVTLWQKRQDLSASNGQIGSWLHKVSFNRALDVKRARTRHPSSELEQDKLADETPSHDTTIEQAECRSKVYEEMSKLPENQMMALMLYYFDDLSVKDISQHMDTTEVAVRSLLKRGKAGLRGGLAQELLTMVT